MRQRRPDETGRRFASELAMLPLCILASAVSEKISSDACAAMLPKGNKYIDKTTISGISNLANGDCDEALVF
jgi:hypothetical protein